MFCVPGGDCVAIVEIPALRFFFVGTCVCFGVNYRPLIVWTSASGELGHLYDVGISTFLKPSTSKVVSNMKSSISIAVLAVVGFVFSASCQAQRVVYQDFFDNDGLATNSGVGGGLTAVSGDGGVFADDGDLSGFVASGASRAFAHTPIGFDVSNGFTLIVDFDQPSIDHIGGSDFAPFNANSFSFGLVDLLSLNALGTIGSGDRIFAGTNGDDVDFDGIGYQTTTRSGTATQGLLESIIGVESSLPGPLNGAGIGQTFVLTVAADGNYVVDLNGTTAFGTTFIDLTQDYGFFTLHQGTNGINISAVTLETVPEPSSIALMLLVGMGVACQRRR